MFFFVCSLRGWWHWLWHPEAQCSRLHRLHIWGEIQRLRPFKGLIPSKWNRPSGNDARLCLWVQLWCIPSCPGLCTMGSRPVVYQHRWVYLSHNVLLQNKNIIYIHLFVYLFFSEYIYIHDDLGLFWITGKMQCFLFYIVILSSTSSYVINILSDESPCIQKCCILCVLFLSCCLQK